MKKLFLCLVLFATSCGGASQQSEWSSIKVQNVASRKIISVDDLLNNRLTIVSLWSVTCTPCRRELPWLQKIYTENTSIQIVGIDIGDNVADIKEFTSALHLTFPIFRDELGAMLSAMKIAQVPATFAVRSDGVVVWKHLGALTYSELQRQIKKFESLGA